MSRAAVKLAAALALVAAGMLAARWWRRRGRPARVVRFDKQRMPAGMPARKPAPPVKADNDKQPARSFVKRHARG